MIKDVYITSEDQFYMWNYWEKILNDLTPIYGNISWIEYNDVTLSDFENQLFTFPLTLYIDENYKDNTIDNRTYKIQHHHNMI